MQKSPYDPSLEEGISRNEKRYKEELRTFQAHMSQIEFYLEKAGITMEEVQQAPPKEPEKPSNRLRRQKWIRI